METFAVGEEVWALRVQHGIFQLAMGKIHEIHREQLGDTAYSTFLATVEAENGRYGMPEDVVLPLERLARRDQGDRYREEVTLFGERVRVKPTRFTERLVTYRRRLLPAYIREHESLVSTKPLLVAEINWQGQIVERDARSML